MNQDDKNNNSINLAELEDVGKFIVTQRESVGWSQAELARKIDYDVANLSKVESNRRGISGKKVVHIYNLVQKERKDRQHQKSVQQQSMQKCANYADDMYRELHQGGMSVGKARGVQESVKAILKSAFTDDTGNE